MKRASRDSMSPFRRPRLYQQLADHLSDFIEAQGLAPGDKLPPERALAMELGVSRATLSQALVALEVQGRVDIRHGDGVVVQKPRSSSAHAARCLQVGMVRSAASATSPRALVPVDAQELWRYVLDSASQEGTRELLDSLDREPPALTSDQWARLRRGLLAGDPDAASAPLWEVTGAARG